MEQKLWGWLSYTWLMLNALDLLTTLAANIFRVRGIVLSGWSIESKISFWAIESLRYYEWNPLIRWLGPSPQVFVILKVVFALLVLCILFLLKKMPLIKIMNYAMAGVVCWNVLWIIADL